MYTKKSSRTTLVWVLGILLSVAANSLSALDPKDRGIHQPVAWSSSQGRVATGVWSLALSERCLVQRLLLEGPSGQLAMIRKVIDAHFGSQKVHLKVGAGWWVELRQEYGVSWPNYRIALRSFAAGPDSPNMDGSVQYTLETSNGFQQVATLPRSLGGEIPNFIEALEKARQKEHLAKKIPAEASEIFRFLTSALEAGSDPSRLVGQESGGLLELGRWAVEAQPLREKPDEFWMLPEVGEGEFGTLTDPELIELVAKFPDLDNVDPLAGTRPSDLCNLNEGTNLAFEPLSRSRSQVGCLLARPSAPLPWSPNPQVQRGR